MRRFEDLQALETSQVEGLLGDPDPRVRIWAAWVLGLRLGAGGLGRARNSLFSEPDPGARRHLLVQLAGLKQVDLLATFAKEDPDAYVRATACQYLAAVGSAQAFAVRALLLERLVQDDDSIVRTAVLSALGTASPSEAAAFSSVARDKDPGVRLAMLDALVNCGEALRPVLLELLSSEPDERVRHSALTLWRDLFGPRSLLQEMPAFASTAASEALALLADGEFRFAWTALEPVLSLPLREVERWVLALLDDSEPSPHELEWLWSLLARAQTAPMSRSSAWWYGCAWAATQRLVSNVDFSQSPSEGMRSHFPDARRWLESALVWGGDEFEDEPGGPHQGQLPERVLLDWLERQG